MGDSVYANLRSAEGTVADTATITFDMRVGRITIINDSSTKSLNFKFSAGESYATLEPTETVSFQLRTKQVLLTGNDVPYRVWGVG